MHTARMTHGYVYILTNKPFGTLYVGVTTDPLRRMEEHKQCVIMGFSNHYSLTNLVYLETFPNIAEASAREKQLRSWRHTHKLDLISTHNPNWVDLSQEWMVAEARSA